MIDRIIRLSLQHKSIVLLSVCALVGIGIYAMLRLPIDAVPDITNNQVQIITTSRNLSTQDVEQFITYPVELEMANLPGVDEIRSVSKFGLSVVTVVFDDAMGTYLPRQLIAEKLRSAEEIIPAHFGRPEMGPISTGLGEIYQYILDTKPGYDSVYSTMDLRSIQDWIVKRQLAGIPGVVEVNTWGGFLKQYEVAVDPERLRSMGIGISEVFGALACNNDITGGGYIEKGPQSYFVRGEGLVRSTEDIGNIVVKVLAGRPVLVRDLGEVRMGYATRFGAITGNGQGEKVLGQVMMLKGANSGEVIEAVKARVAEVQKTLPEGVYINPFLERTELIRKTTFTVAENLILGALIVIFVVVLLLGNLRSGLIVASVIPLSLLFALTLMYIFGVGANLMSLGAIDFGIIIDGSVIIVEYVVYRFAHHHAPAPGTDRKDARLWRDELVFDSSSRMMRSAIFGQIIILIVFIPILSLSGIEGKMFRPMAMSFSFALVGAMLLCLTYVPVMAALLLRPGQGHGSFADRLLVWTEDRYESVLRLALRFRYVVLGAALLLLVAAVLIFTRMGGEFVPTLDEGDFVIQPIMKPGTSLSETVRINTRIERLILDNYPEVSQVVSRIGAAEVPTDPMSMEMSDIIIRLKPRSEWVSAASKEELAEKIKETLSVLPGIGYEFTQPIEMRFNELITGVRADLAIKVYGEDLDILFSKGNEIRDLVAGVAGAADVTVEQIAGLPQLSVVYRRAQIARYGLDISELNRIVRMAFGGETSGVVFEGERRYDLVVRLPEDQRQDIDQLRNLAVALPRGGSLPLREVADIDYAYGPAQISRDDTHRRIVVSINVRNRDMESMVEEIQGILDARLDLPTGYTIDYGGQFENLRQAKARLAVAVPVALLLIFILLHFTFHSLRQAAMVYTAIPMAAIGGVLLLWLRGLPFSISAGVGFIALFGIAVLNGIVLVSYFNELKAAGMTQVLRRVLVGTRRRLRPVLLTATAAALGFLPMALSTSSGAEVQRPLATVVIGGLISATLLTLVVLPIIYSLVESWAEGRAQHRRAGVAARVVVAVVLLLPLGLPAQEIDMVGACHLAETHNQGLRAVRQQIAYQEALRGAAWDIDRTTLYHSYDGNNIAENGFPLQVFGVQQTLAFPTRYGLQAQMADIRSDLARETYALGRQQLARAVSLAFLDVQYARQQWQTWKQLDSLYRSFAAAAAQRYRAGETGRLEALAAQARVRESETRLRQLQGQTDEAYTRFKALVQADFPLQLIGITASRLPLPADSLDAPALRRYRLQQAAAHLDVRQTRQQALPDLHGEYFYGVGIGAGARAYQGYQIGLSIPLWPRAHMAQVQASRLQAQIVASEAEDYTLRLQARREALRIGIATQAEGLAYYETEGLALADALTETAAAGYHAGETSYLEYLRSLEDASRIRLAFIEQLYLYNQAVIALRYVGAE